MKIGLEIRLEQIEDSGGGEFGLGSARVFHDNRGRWLYENSLRANTGVDVTRNSLSWIAPL